MHSNKLCVSLILSIAPLLAFDATAGSATVASKDGQSSTFEYSDKYLRISIPGQDGYALVRDGSIYTVMQQDGRTLVIDAGSAMKGMGAGVPTAVPAQFNSEIGSLDKTGRSETVAGIKGEVYQLNYVDENGNEQSEEMVLSDDPRALEFRDGLFLMIGVASQLTSEGTEDSTASIQKALSDIDSGILRYGQDMTVTEINSDGVDPSRFELPAEPLNLQGIGAMLGSMSQQAGADDGAADELGDSEAEPKKKGLFGSVMGAIGEKVNRQSDRLGDSAEQEIDAETDEKVDGALDKAFGKLFGR
ncbi:hypothetical protein [Congregibacter sp.]|uniref:hypothetical protein n=1 Tax=Congregibacter sp. TaxID=2744308 RepID=UPI00385F5CA5